MIMYKDKKVPIEEHHNNVKQGQVNMINNIKGRVDDVLKEIAYGNITDDYLRGVHAVCDIMHDFKKEILKEHK